MATHSHEDHGHEEHGHDHDHPHEPIKKIDPQLPEHVIRLIAIGESLGDTGRTVVEDSRNKADELKSKGLTKGLSYFEKRLLTTRAMLQDKKILADRETESMIQLAKRQLKEQGKDMGEFEIAVDSLASALIEKGIITKDAVDAKYEVVRARTPMTGAKIIARAWVDPEFKDWLKKDARGAIESWNRNLLDANNGEAIDTWRVTRLQVLENTKEVRNVIVCTLCSCYPRGILGEPPEWYTSDDYRERIITEPRKVLEGMGTPARDDEEIKVYDSTADIRYMVIPRRPEGTEGWSQEQLAELVTRDSLIGVTDPKL
ncbi:MAG: nitrile hydratase subunit alpha [Nitrososphaerales archaeon]